MQETLQAPLIFSVVFTACDYVLKQISPAFLLNQYQSTVSFFAVFLPIIAYNYWQFGMDAMKDHRMLAAILLSFVVVTFDMILTETLVQLPIIYRITRQDWLVMFGSSFLSVYLWSKYDAKKYVKNLPTKLKSLATETI